MHLKTAMSLVGADSPTSKTLKERCSSASRRISRSGLIRELNVFTTMGGHRRICSKTHSKRHRGTLSGDFGGAEIHAGAALWAKCCQTQHYLQMPVVIAKLSANMATLCANGSASLCGELRGGRELGPTCLVPKAPFKTLDSAIICGW